MMGYIMAANMVIMMMMNMIMILDEATDLMFILDGSYDCDAVWLYLIHSGLSRMTAILQIFSNETSLSCWEFFPGDPVNSKSALI